MKFTATKTELQYTPEYFLKRAGYRFIYDKKSGRETFIKPIHSISYPRFHIYIEKTDSTSSPQAEQIIFNLHLDQKKPSYKGSPAHSAEYEGPVVKKEIERLKNLIEK